jgi:hypothetical protein
MKSIAAIAAGLCCVLLASAPVLAEIFSPAGTWTTGSKDSRYEITLCGDGDDMCGKLIWSKDQSPAVARYVNTTIVDTARRIANQQWRGVAVIGGNRFRGTLTLLDRDTLHIRACNGFVCGEFDLYRE